MLQYISAGLSNMFFDSSWRFDSSICIINYFIFILFLESFDYGVTRF